MDRLDYGYEKKQKETFPCFERNKYTSYTGYNLDRGKVILAVPGGSRASVINSG